MPSMLQVFLQALAHPSQIDWVTACRNINRTVIPTSQFNERLPTRVFTPAIVWFKSRQQDSTHQRLFFLLYNFRGQWLTFLEKSHRNRVDAVPCILLGESFAQKDVTKVSVTAIAMYFRSVPAKLIIRFFTYMIRRNGLKVTWPASA